MSSSPETDILGRPRGTLVALVLALTLALGLLLASQLSLGGPGGTPETGAAAVGQTAEATGDGPEGAGSATATEIARNEQVAAATETLTQFLAASDRALRRSDGTAPEVRPFATQPMIEEVHAQTVEFSMQKFTQTGTVRVIEVDAVDVTQDGSAMTLRACLGTSAIEIVDSGGDDVLAAQDPETRSLHIYTLQSDGRTWRVAGHSFPDDATC